MVQSVCDQHSLTSSMPLDSRIWLVVTSSDERKWEDCAVAHYTWNKSPGGGGGPLLHPNALFLEHSTPVHPLPLHGGQILTWEGRVSDEKVAWLLPLLDPSQVPCRSVAPQPSSCWYPSLQSKEHPLLLPHLTAGPFDYGFFLQSNSICFLIF